MTVIHCYSLTNDADPELEGISYKDLQAEVERIPTQDLLIVMGDLDAMIESDNTSNERVMGKHGYDRMNENGEWLMDFCGINNLAMGGSLFPQKYIQKITWISLSGRENYVAN